MNGRSRFSWARPLAKYAVGLAAGASIVAAQGCLDRPVKEITPGSGGIVSTKLRVTKVDKVDLLLMIDNSASMADKFTELGKRMPELIKALANPDLDATGKPVSDHVADLHVGVITSSLGSHGTSVCDASVNPHNDDHGHLMPRAGENGTQGYTVDKVGGTPTPASCPSPVAATALSWAFNPNDANARFKGTNQVNDMEAGVACVVQSAKEDGCGYEAQLESIYHFLIDPAPYQTADVQCQKNPAGDACGQNAITVNGVDQEILNERAAFLRPDSLLAVIMLTDENDGSILPAGLNWLPLAYGKGTMAHGWKACENVPDDFEPQSKTDYDTLKNTYGCQSCFQPGTDPGGNCNTPWPTTTLDQDVDGRNERMLMQTRRYGFNFLWGRQRYVDAFSAGQVAASDGTLKPNPIFVGGQRTKDLVVVAGILGVPKSLLPADQSADIDEAHWDKIVSPDLSKRDVHMVESIAPRQGQPIFSGDRTVDLVNGGDRHVASGDDLQYACIQQKSVPSTGTAAADCQAANAGTTNPLCDNSATPTQSYFKAYPTLRELRVLHELQKVQVPITVASLCDSSYSGAIHAIINKLQAALNAQCLKSILNVDQNGAVTCEIIESFSTAAPTTATGTPVTKCEDLNGGGSKVGYCTPGTEPCRIPGSTNYPPLSLSDAANQLQLQITVTDANGLATTEAVQAVADPDGNVYATGSDGKKHLVCEMLQLAGNPAVPAGDQQSCLNTLNFSIDPTAGLPDDPNVTGGWCYSKNTDVLKAQKCPGAIGTMRFFGVVQPHGGSEVFTVCNKGTG